MGKVMSFDELREQEARKEACDNLKSHIRQPQGQPGRSAGHHARADRYRVAKIQPTKVVHKLIRAHLRRHAVNLKLDELLEEYAPIGQAEHQQQQQREYGINNNNNMDAFRGQGHILGSDDKAVEQQLRSFEEEWEAASRRANNVDVSDVRAELDDLELETYGVEERDVARTAEHYGSAFLAGWALIMPGNAWAAIFENSDDDGEVDSGTGADMDMDTTDTDADEDGEDEDEEDNDDNDAHDHDHARWEDILASHGLKISRFL